MHTVMVMVGGFLLLGLCLLIGRWTGRPGRPGLARGAKIFVALWLIAASINMWVGVSRAGYTVAEEFPIFLFIFAVPASLAVFLWWKYG